MWGYFVAPAATSPIPAQEADETPVRALRVLWVGRLLRLKRVDTLFKAVYVAQVRCPIVLTIVGIGPELPRLRKLDRQLAKKIRGSISDYLSCGGAGCRGSDVHADA